MLFPPFFQILKSLSFQFLFFYNARARHLYSEEIHIDDLVTRCSVLFISYLGLDRAFHITELLEIIKECGAVFRIQIEDVLKILHVYDVSFKSAAECLFAVTAFSDGYIKFYIRLGNIIEDRESDYF